MTTMQEKFVAAIPQWIKDCLAAEGIDANDAFEGNAEGFGAFESWHLRIYGRTNGEIDRRIVWDVDLKRGPSDNGYIVADSVIETRAAKGDAGLLGR